MGETSFAQFFRQNWLLVLIMTLAVFGAAVGTVMAMLGYGRTPVAAPVAQLNPSAVLTEDQMRAILFAPPPPAPPTPAEEKLKAINEHRARFEADPEGPEADALLSAMGNLYKQLGDFNNAAWAYQQFLKRFPDNSGRTGVYMNLAACYDQLGEADKLRTLFVEMMKEFAPDTNQYKYAEARLKMSDVTIQQRNPNAAMPPGPEGTFEVETLPDGSTRYLDPQTKEELKTVPPRPQGGS